MRRARTIALLIGPLGVVSILAQQRPADPAQADRRQRPEIVGSLLANIPATGVMRGRVLTTLGRPAAHATVRVLGALGTDLSTTADDQGRFEIAELKPDAYRVSAAKVGYLTLEYGQKRAFERGTPVPVFSDRTLWNIEISLPPGGALVGRVIDEHGYPLQGVNVRLLQSRFSGGRRKLLEVAGVTPRFTDDTGRYRLFGIPPGDYIVVGSPPNSPLFLPAKNQLGYASTYYPGALLPSEARPISVGISQVSSGVDFVLASAAPARITGIALDSNGGPLIGTMALTTTDQWGGLAVAMQVPSARDGTFQLANVQPGDYVLQAIGPRPGDRRGEGEFGAIPISVNGRDLDNLPIQTSAGSRAAGRLVFEGDSLGQDPRPNFQDIVLVFAPADLDRAPSNESFLHRWRPERDGTFVMTGLNGPRRLRLLTAPASWTIRRVTADGVDITDEVISFGSRQESIANLEIVMTNRTAAVTGKVVDERDQLILDYTAVVFGADSRQWYPESRFVKITRPRPDGAFAVRGLPAGDYFVAAVDWLQADDVSGEWQDPEFLETLAGTATRISLSDSEEATVTPKLFVR